MSRFAAATLILGSMATVSLAIVAAQIQPRSESDRHAITTARAEQDNLFRTSGLEAAAAVTGTYTTTSRVTGAGGPADLRDLVDESALAAVGRVASQTMRLQEGGRRIWTAYGVRLEQTFKGQLEDMLVTILVPGGRVLFPNGNIATERLPKFMPPLSDRQYLLFARQSAVRLLWRDSDEERLYPIFELTNVYLGSMELVQGQPVRTSGMTDSPVARQVMRNEMRPTELISLVQDLAKLPPRRSYGDVLSQ